MLCMTQRSVEVGLSLNESKKYTKCKARLTVQAIVHQLNALLLRLILICSSSKGISLDEGSSTNSGST